MSSPNIILDDYKNLGFLSLFLSYDTGKKIYTREIDANLSTFKLSFLSLLMYN